MPFGFIDFDMRFTEALLWIIIRRRGIETFFLSGEKGYS